MTQALLLLCALVAAPQASAAELLERRLTVDDGLPVHWVSALAQDDAGDLWLAGPGGLVRWDGTQATVFGAGRIGHHARRVVTGGGRVVVVESHDVGWEWVDGEVRPLLGADGSRLGVQDAWLAETGELLVVGGGRILRRTVDGAWSPALEGAIAEQARRLDAGPDGSLLLGGRTGWWTWRPGAPPRFLIEGTGAIQGLVDEHGELWVMDARPVRVRRRRDGVWKEVWRDGSSWNNGFTVRDGVLWTGHDGRLWIVDDERTELFGDDGIPVEAGGPWLTDHEGAIWSASYQGAIQYPAPELRIWGTPAGLPSETVRDLVVRPQDVVASSWLGVARLMERGRGEVQPIVDPLSKGLICASRNGTAWYRGRADGGRGATFDVALGPDGTRVDHPAPPGTHFLYGCAPASVGGVWLIDRARLFLLGEPDAAARDLGSVPVPAGRNSRVLEDADGRLWISGDRTVCRAEVADVLAGTAAWRCEEVPASVHLDDLHQTEAGSIWAAERTGGVWRHTAAGWEVVPGAADLPTRNLKGLAASPRGGTWVLGAMAPIRVLDRPDREAGWEVVEHLPDWLGSTFSAVKDLVEEPDGTLWLATHIGVVRIPARARNLLPDPPSVRVPEIRVDGVRVRDEELVLPAGASLGLRLSAGTLRHPRQVVYRSRIDGGPWSVPTPTPALELAALGPGSHTVEVSASFDAEIWSPQPAVVRVQVAAPWWQRPWVWLLAGLALGGLALAGLQLRATLRLRDERLRTRVAMDLHDEVGAGLASIGLLAGLVESSQDDPGLQALSSRIASDAEDLGASVSGMVWSLRPGHATVPALADFLRARAQALLPHLHAAGDLHVACDPDTEALGDLDLDVLRAVQLVALEAMHNIARHAAATEVRIAVSRRARQLHLEILDDGVGFDPDRVSTAPDHGLGLASMTERMRTLGGRCTITPRDEGGTAVRITVAPRRRRLWFLP